MVDEVEVLRWQTAQSFEQGYWNGMSVPELQRVCADMGSFMERSIPAHRRDDLFAGKDVLEIGCGPLGISIASFYGGPPIRRLVKSEPLPKIDITTVPPAAPNDADFLSWMKKVSEHGEYLQSAGEGLDFSGSFDTVLTFNVLDHVQDPATILSNALKALRPGGHVLIGVDCRSVLGKLKFNQYTRRVSPNTTLVQAHPFTFLVSDVLRMLQKAGFTAVEVYGKPSFFRGFAGGIMRPVFIGRKAL